MAESTPSELGFGLDNLPLGVTASGHIAVRIEDKILDLHELIQDPTLSSLLLSLPSISSLPLDSLASILQTALVSPSLNLLASHGSSIRRELRSRIRHLLIYHHDDLSLRPSVMVSAASTPMGLPFAIGDYTDFYAGRHHAFNVGRLFRNLENAIQPNYDTMPIAYHGRASTVVSSMSPIFRPLGQIRSPKTGVISVQYSQKLDFEVELGCFIGKGNERGKPISVDNAEEEYIFGYVLLNDWSARDIQAFEYIPLGPFNGKNFATSISPWVISPEALTDAARGGIENPSANEVAGYLKKKDKSTTTREREKVLDIRIDTFLKHQGEKEGLEGKDAPLTSVRTTEGLMWSFAQMIAHHTLGGCAMRPGDLIGSGTISGIAYEQETGRTEDESRGSLLEITENGKIPFCWGEAEKKTWLDDGDIVTMAAMAEVNGKNISFGEVTGTIVRYGKD